MSDSGLKEQARSEVAKRADELLNLSHSLWDNPEIAFKETRSADVVVEALANIGFNVDVGVADLPTAFVATFGSGSLNIGICAEYDALPSIGHACGHNIIAASAVGAAAALAQLAETIDITVTVLGTPAEEGGGGKVYMLQRGAFDGLNAAMMVHAGPFERDAMATLANSRIDITFTGKAAHAAAAPHRGINAASAMSLAQAGVGMLREHLLPTDRVHGIVTHGGDAMNIIPEKVTGYWCTRAATVEREQEVFDLTAAVFNGAAQMMGCSVEFKRSGPVYADVRTNEEMASMWRDNARALGRDSLPIQPTDGYASTDMGNVSYAIPSIHPIIALDSQGANIHETEFAAHARATTGDKAVIDGAIGMAWTAIDIASSDALRKRLESKAYRVVDEDQSAPYLSLTS